MLDLRAVHLWPVMAHASTHEGDSVTNRAGARRAVDLLDKVAHRWVEAEQVVIHGGGAQPGSRRRASHS